MNQLTKRKKGIHYKSQRQSPINPILRLHSFNQQQTTPDTIFLKRPSLSKLKHLKVLPFKIQNQSLTNIKNNIIAQHKTRIITEANLKKKAFLPEIQNTKKQVKFKSDIRQVKLQSKRILDKVNQLYSFFKSDSSKNIKSRKIIEDQNPEDLKKITRRRHKTLDNKQTLMQHNTIQSSIKRKSVTQETNRLSDKRVTQQTPQSGLLFTFYPQPEEQINQFLE